MSQKKSILIVEDEAIVAKDLQYRLETKGYHVPKVVQRGLDALAFLKDQSVDLILMDIHLKGSLDGVQTATQIQAQSFVPIIYLTAFNDVQTIQEAVRSEPFGYIVKPYDEQTLFIQIEVALYKSKIDAEIRNREKWYHSILANLSEAVITTDMSGAINFVNGAGLILLEARKDEVLQTPVTQILELLDEDGRQFDGHPIQRTLAKGVATYSETVLLRTQSFKLKAIACQISPLKDREDEQVGSLVVLRDRNEAIEKSERFYHIQKTIKSGSKIMPPTDT